MKMRYLLLFLACLIFGHNNAQGQVAAYLSHTDSLEINLIKKVNHYRYTDRHPSISPDGQTLYFASERGGNPWSYPYTTRDSIPYYLSDLWKSELGSGGWGKPECLPFGLNSSRADLSPISDEDGLYFFSLHPSYDVQGGPFFKASKTANLWETPVGLGGELTTFFQDKGGEIDGFTFGPDKKWLIFSWGEKDSPNDLYISIDRGGEKGWSRPQKMAVSTPADDRAPFLMPNGKTLLFSTLHTQEGFGGYDLVLVRKGDNGRWGNIINLSAPFNTEHDETGISIAPGSRKAILVRDGNLYEVDLAGAHPYLRGE